ncbi:5-oxoprolinase subunit PxpB [Ignatzschineria larvae DSM 13226]|uniref:5-oxoprolinase subunit PxpB n=1 Tax=Ignatzschineria larvae DSM 13226 TaxID=1111732 RepID=A0ABZ3BZR9_9GAMM|nr:5-oxoprolinase subunit PxpB [Ignatzschineria larvae]
MSIAVYCVGDRGITLSTSGEMSLENQQKIWWISQEIAREKNPMVIDIVPGMNNLTLFLNPYLSIDKSILIQQLQQLWLEAGRLDLTTAFRGKLIEVPVTYGGEKGPDLLEVAQIHQITPEEVVALHTAATYTVYFVGFMPGFVYLGGLDPKIHTDRRAVPRVAIPAGSVGIGGSQTGVYPGESPGGWQILGNTELAFFDLSREQPTLFMPGDQLRFVAKEILL